MTPVEEVMCKAGAGRAVQVFVWFLALALFATAGCKKKDGDKKEGKGRAAKAPPAAKAQPTVEEKGTPAGEAGLPGDIADDSGEESGETKAGTKEAPAEEKAAEIPVPDTPPAGVRPDRERLGRLFVEMWCAQQEGAGPDRLMEIYQKEDFPPLDSWYQVWNDALLDAKWARTIYEQAKSRCYHVVKEGKAGEAPPLKAPPLPTGGDKDKAQPAGAAPEAKGATKASPPAGAESKGTDQPPAK